MRPVVPQPPEPTRASLIAKFRCTQYSTLLPPIPLRFEPPPDRPLPPNVPGTECRWTAPPHRASVTDWGVCQTLASNSNSAEKEGEVHDFEMAGRDTSPSTSLPMIVAMAPFVRQMSPGLASAALEIGLLESPSARNTPLKDSPTNPGFSGEGGGRGRGEEW